MANNILNHQQPAFSTNEKRQNLYIIFADFSVEETATIIASLRENNFAPRGYNLNSLDNLQDVLSQRSWDFILCRAQQDTANSLTIKQTLVSAEKDIPIIEMVDKLTIELVQKGIENQIQAVLALNNTDLLLIHIQREIEHLNNRRENRRLQSQLIQSQQRCKELMDHSSLAICFIHQQKIVYLNDAFAQQLGYQVKDLLLNKSVFNLLATQESDGLNTLLSEFNADGKSSQPYQVLAKRADQSHFTAHIVLTRTLFNNDDCVEIALHKQKQIKDEDNFNKLDPTTGLYNQTSFNQILNGQINQAHQGGNDCHLLYIHLANFSETKRLHGPHASRLLVRDITDIINDTFNNIHIKSRISDDVFGILYLEPSLDISYDIACQLSAKLRQHSHSFDEKTLVADTRIAIIPITDIAPTAEQVLLRGETSLAHFDADTQYSAQECVVTFNRQNNTSQHEMQSIDAVKKAIKQDKLRLLYQPIVPLTIESNKEHYEVFLRMLDDNNQEIPPQQFLASVDHALLNEDMDRWVLKHSIDVFKAKREANQSLRLFISVTDTVWEKQEFLLWIAESLRNSRIEADCIVIQISETEAATKQARAKFFADGLRKLNCLISLKHYGSTNHSQDILRIIKPDYVKLDGSYIAELAESTTLDSEFTQLLSNIKNSGVMTIAPQVETPKVMSLLWKSGVAMMQGYYLQGPLEEMHYDFD